MILMLVAAALLAVGCAKQPAPTATTTPAGAETPVDSQPLTVEQLDQGSEEIAVAGSGVSEDMLDEESATALERIHFAFDRYDLSDEAQAILINNADYLKAHADQKVRIEGFCDERGSDEYNLALGERRARAARNYLVSLGIAADRINIISYGEEMPLDPTQTEEAYALNRRAEFKATP
jgi:peptidoglycan-associated lipoprotein